jgi:hypothetical protein
MSKEKAENYSVEDVMRLREVYTAEGLDDAGRKEAVVSLADELNRSEASVRSKLVNMGVYKKAEKVTKTGEKIESKGTIVNEIADLIGASVESFDSLEKANKSVLQSIREALTIDIVAEFEETATEADEAEGAEVAEV